MDTGQGTDGERVAPLKGRAICFEPTDSPPRTSFLSQGSTALLRGPPHAQDGQGGYILFPFVLT